MKKQISICMNCGQSFEWFPEWYAAKGLQAPPLKCQRCCDQRQGKAAIHTVRERECLQEFPCCDVTQATERLNFEIIDQQDGRRIRPYRRAIVKGRNFGASWSGRIDVFDQRSNPASLAHVRVMRTHHEAGAQMTGIRVTGPGYPWTSKTTYKWEHSNEWQYVALDDATDEEPTCRLVVVSAIQKWNRDDRITGKPLWSCSCSGSSRSGRHSGQATLAVVDADHPLTVTQVQDHGALHAGDRITLERAPLTRRANEHNHNYETTKPHHD